MKIERSYDSLGYQMKIFGGEIERVFATPTEDGRYILYKYAGRFPQAIKKIGEARNEEKAHRKLREHLALRFFGYK